MTEPTPSSPADSLRAGTEATRSNIRGSSLLAAGRIIAVGINFLVHVLIVRYLSQGDYGAFAYALSTVSLGSSIAVFGMNKTLARFVPIYEEREDYAAMFGAIAVGIAIMSLLSIGLVAGFYVSQGLLADLIVDSDLALAVLMIIVLLLPLQAFDSALLGLFAIFGSARHIFWRRHIFAPLLSLVVTVLVITGGFDVYVLAAATVMVAALGLTVYTGMLIGVMRKRGLFKHLVVARLRYPVRELLGFSLPLLSTDVVFMLRGSVVVILLGSMAGVSEVALFSAVAPIASQNTLVLDSFRLLYTPAASRLYAHDDAEGINDLYWQSAIWVVIVTLPILLASVSLAGPVAVFLFGDEYAQSATVLAILGVGYFLNSAFGHNGLTLRVFGRVRYLVMVDLLTAGVGVAATVPMIDSWGALGAAIGITLIFATQNILYQIGLWRSTTVSGFAVRYLPVYLGVPMAVGGLLAVQLLVNPPLWMGIGLAAVVWLAYFAVNRRFLRLDEMFPELRRMPIARLLLR